MDFLQHSEYSFISSTMIRSPQGSNTCCDTGKRIGKRAARNSDCRSWSILLMIGMTNPNDFQSFNDWVCNLKFFRHRIGKHHVEEVFHVPVILFWLYNRKTHWSSVCIGCESRHFCDKFNGEFMSIMFIIEIVVWVKKSRKGTNHTYHNCHRMGLSLESLIELNHSFVKYHLADNCLLKLIQFWFGRKLSIQQKIASFYIVRMFGQFLNLVSTIHKLTQVPIDISNSRHATRSARISRVIGC